MQNYILVDRYGSPNTTEGIHFIFQFPDNPRFGASVICTEYSYGGKQGQFEIAHITFLATPKDTNPSDDYLWHMTEGLDVRGYVEFWQLDSILRKLSQGNFCDLTKNGVVVDPAISDKVTMTVGTALTKSEPSQSEIDANVDAFKRWVKS